MITKEVLIKDLQKIGLKKGDILNLKVSLKSIGSIEGGPKTLIDAVLDVIGSEGTLISDSFIEEHYSMLRLFFRNNISQPNTQSYAGAFANEMIKYPGAKRSTHPIQAFTAVGKSAELLTSNFTKDSRPYQFLKEIAKLGGKNLRIGEKVIGVGTTHIAICELGFKQKYLPIGVYYIDNGKRKYYDHYWASGCNAGFNKLIPYYRDNDAILGESKIGNAQSVLTDMNKTMAIEFDLFKERPDAFFCDKPACPACSFTWDNSHYSFMDCVKANIKERKFKRVIYITMVQLFGTWHPSTTKSIDKESSQ